MIAPVPTSLRSATTRLTPDELRSGDLVFFANTYLTGISNVGIYLGDGQQINAPGDLCRYRAGKG